VFDQRSYITLDGVSTWMGDCLPTGKPLWYVTNCLVNLAFHPSGVGKLNTGLSVWG